MGRALLGCLVPEFLGPGLKFGQKNFFSLYLAPLLLL